MQPVQCNLANCFLCTYCLPDWKEVIAVKKTTLNIKRGKKIFSEGDKVNGIYFINSGAAKVHKQWGPQKELILRFAKTGDILGHRGISDDSNLYPISATALEDTKICFITNDFLETTLKTNYSLASRLLHFYATELQKAEKRMRDMAHMEVKGRVANALLEIAHVFGINKDEHIALPITRQDIASYAGTTYETVFKFLTELTNSSIISVSGKSIKINNPDALKQFTIHQTE